MPFVIKTHWKIFVDLLKWPSYWNIWEWCFMNSNNINLLKKSFNLFSLDKRMEQAKKERYEDDNLKNLNSSLRI